MQRFSFFAGAMLLWSAWVGAWIATGGGRRALPSRSVSPAMQPGVVP